MRFLVDLFNYLIKIILLILRLHIVCDIGKSIIGALLMYSNSHDQISALFKRVFGGSQFQETSPKKTDFLDMNFELQLEFNLRGSHEVKADQNTQKILQGFTEELGALNQDFRSRLVPVLQSAIDRHNSALVARLAAQRLSAEVLLEQCTPRLALAVEIFRRENAETRAEQAMQYADYCHRELKVVEGQARERRHRSTARKAAAAARRIKQMKPKVWCFKEHSRLLIKKSHPRVTFNFL
jgi:hypothetical protein